MRARRLTYLLAVALLIPPTLQAQNTITTVVGGGNPSGLATSADVVTPSGVAVDNLGNLYIGQFLGSQVFKVTPSGIISVLAGTNYAGYGGDGGPAANAVFRQTIRVALDANENVYVADYASGRVRRIDAHTGTVTTVAGSATPCTIQPSPPCGDGGLATQASLYSPEAIAFDSAGNLFIADHFAERVRRVDAVTGVITTVAGNGAKCVTAPCGDGGLATQAQLRAPRGVAVDGSGNLFIADGQGIRRVNASTHVITTLVTPTDTANYLIFENSGNLLVSGGQTVYRVNIQTLAITTLAGSFSCVGFDGGDGGPAASACLGSPYSVAEDAAGTIYIGQFSSNRVRKIDNSAQHIITTFAGGGSGGDGGPARGAILAYPGGGALDSGGNGFIVDAQNYRIRRVDATTNVITTVAGTGDSGFTGDNGPAVDATLGLIAGAGTIGFVIDTSDYMYFPDSGSAVRRIDAGGTITTFAGGATQVCADPTTPCGDGGPANFASFNNISGLALDQSNNLFIGDTNDSRVRLVNAATGIVSTVAGNGTSCPDPTTPCGDGGLATAANLGCCNPLSVAVDAGENLFIADGNDFRVRRVDAITGIISTVAGNGTACANLTTPCGDGGAATTAELYLPEAITFDGSGNLFIADSNRIRRVDAVTKTITTVAGNAAGGFGGDGGPALAAGLNFPSALWVDGSENLFIADAANNRIRQVVLSATATFSGNIANFGSELVGAHSAAQTVTLTNTGANTLIIESISVSGTGFASTNTCTNTNDSLAPAQSCTVSVTFTAPTVGLSSGSLSISTNDPTTPTKTYSFGGTGSTSALTTIALTPANPSIIAALTQQFTAIATYADASTQNLTDSAVWTTSSSGTATISNTGLATGVAAGTTSVRATSGSISASTNLTVTAPVLEGIAVSPATPFLIVAQTLQFTATAIFNNGTEQDVTNSVTWSSSSPANATISAAGLATPVALGTATITATDGSFSATATVTVVPAGFTITGSLNVPRLFHTATLLNNGKVLIAGGEDASSNFLNSAELYDPASGTFAFTGNMNFSRVFHSATLLNNGKVLIVGGNTNGSPDAELYDPTTGTFTLTGSLSSIFFEAATATLLKNGQVLVAGGENAGGVSTAAQLYDPSTGLFTATGSLNVGRQFHTATLLDNGKVLLAGGENSGGDLASAELYDPAAGTFTLTGSLGTAAFFFEGGSTLLNSGMALISGGDTLASLQLYNPATGLFASTGAFPSGFFFFDNSAALLTNGTVLLAGGDNSSSFNAAAIYDPGSATTTLTGQLNTGRVFSTATLLNNGKVLVAGGESLTGPTPDVALANAELYTPSSLTPANLTSISITPAAPTIHTGAVQQFIATGTFVGGTTQILKTVTWTSSNGAVATITNGGTNGGAAFGLTAGSTTITACAGVACGSTSLTVTSGTPPTLTSVSVTPANPSIPKGTQEQFAATGHFSDGSTQPLTNVTWSSGTPAVASVSSAGLANGLTAGTSTITATTGNLSGSTVLTVTAPILVSIAVTPASPSIAAGANLQFTATGKFSDSSTQNLTSSVTWSSGTTATATITAAGLAHGVAAGTSTIKATSGSVNGSAVLTVTLQTLTISCSPSACGAVLGGEATNSNPIFSIGTPTSTGLSGAAPTGIVALGVLLPEPTALSSWTLGTGSASIASGTGVPGYASGNVFPLFGLTTGESIDFSVFHALSAAAGVNAASYNAFSFGIATIHGGGTSSGPITFTGFNGASSFPLGTIFFPYLLDSNQANRVVNLGPIVVVNTVAAPTLVSIAVTPTNPSLAAGTTQQFTATGTFSDGTTQKLTASVTWASSTPAAATINAAGLATAVAPGTTTITATSGNIHGSTGLTATAATLVSIAVTPANSSLATGLTRQFTATGTLSNGTTENLTSSATWNSSTPAAATINTAGLATAVAAGATTITATSGNISGSTTLTVTPPTLVSIAVTPATLSIAAGLTRQFTATGTLSNGTTQNITTSVTWAPGTPATATINAAGLATAVAVGTTTISATSGSISGSATLTVSAAILSSITVTPADPSLTPGLTLQFTATGTFSNGTTQNITGSVNWTSTSTATATISTTGLATAVASGSTRIAAFSGGIVSGNTILTVPSPTLVSVAVTPATVTLLAGTTQQFTATGTFTDGTTKNLTGSSVWSSSAVAIATVNTTGFASGLTAGTASITAISSGISGTASLTVSPSGNSTPMIGLNPSSLTFANQLIGTASGAQGITVSNTGTAALTINSIALTGTNPAEFSETNNCPVSPATLAVGGNCNVQVQFAPLAVGTRTANVTFTDNTLGIPGSQQSVPVTGGATAPAPITTTMQLSYPVGTNVSEVATVNCPSHTTPCTDPNAHSLKLVVGQVLTPFTLTVTSFEVPLSQADGVCPAGATETTDFDCRFKSTFTLQTEPNGDVIVPQCIPFSNGNCVFYRISNVPPQSSYVGPVFENFSWNNNAFVPSSFYAANNPRLFDDPDAPPFDVNHQFVFDITDFFESNGNKVGVDPTIHGHTKQYNDFVVAFTAALPNPALTLTFQAPLGSGSPTFQQGASIPVAFTLFQVTNPITDAVTSPNAVSIGLANAQGVRFAALAPDGSAAAFTFNPTAGQYVLSLATQALSPGVYSLMVNSNLFVQQSTSFTIAPAPLAITTASPLAAGNVGVAYSQTLTATGGVPPFTWSLASGNLPAGLTISAAGVISGTPTAAITGASFNMQVKDSTAVTAAKQFTLTIGPPTLVSIAITPANPSIVIGGTQQFTATGTFSNGSTQNLTGSVTWSSATPAAATITSAGLATGVAVGTSTIRATSGNIVGATTLTVTTVVIPEPVIGLSPGSLTFANQLIGSSSAAQTITAHNAGTAALTINSIVLSGTNPAEFKETNDCPVPPATLAAGASCAVQVSFAPLAVGTRTANVTFTDNTGGVAGSTQNIPLSGAASAPAPITTTVQLSYPVGTNVSQVATINCPSHTTPCTDPNAHSLKLVVSQVLTPFTLTVTAFEVSLSQADGVCPAGATETTDFDCRFKSTFTLQTEPNGDVIVPQCIPFSNGNCVFYRISNVPPQSSYVGPVFENFSWNNNAFVPSSFYAANNPRLFDDPDAPPFDVNHQFVFDITDFFESNGNKVGVDPTIHGHTKQYNDFVVAFTAALPNPALTLTFQPPLGSGSPSFAKGATIPVAFTLKQGTTTITNAVTSPNAVSIGLANAQGARFAALAPDGTPAAFTFNTTSQQYGLTLATQALPPGVYTLFVNSNLFVQQSTSFTVTPATLVSIAVTPANPSIPQGNTQQFTATGTFSDGSTQALSGVTWTSSFPQEASINASGLATALSIGTVTMTATSGSISGTTTLKVTTNTPQIAAKVLDSGTASGSFFIDLQLTNTGVGTAKSLTLSTLAFRTLTGTGTVTYNAQLSPQLPDNLGGLAAGSTATIRLFLSVPSTVSRFSVSESGTFGTSSGQTLTFASVQAVTNSN